MTVKRQLRDNEIQKFIGLSTDQKPIGRPVDSSFKELDTGRFFLFNGSTWVLSTQQSGAATEVKQDDIIDEISNKDVMMAIRRLLQLIANPSYVDKTVNQIRAQVTGTTTVSGSLTTVTTVTGLTNLNAYAANLLVIDQNRAAWASVVRGRIT